MTLKDLKEWVNSLPEEFMDYNVANGEVGFFDTNEEEGGYSYRIDKPVTALTVDEETKEILIMNDAQEPLNSETLNQLNK